MVNDAALSVEVAYGTAERQLLVEVPWREGDRLQDAIDRSGLLDRCPEIDLAINKVGVFGKLAKLDSPLQTGDRVEIYRPLIADPKEQRKRRAAEGKLMKKGGGEAAKAEG